MRFLVIWSYDNYIPAHIAKGVLEEEGITSWLKDENSVTIDPILTNALGGIKLMVPEEDAKRATDILQKLHREHKATTPCPVCGSHNIEQVSTPRKAGNWFSVILGLFATSYAMPVHLTYHCFNCGNEFTPPEEK